MRHDLEGITVVALEQAVAAPYASSRLADAGARVIKLERHEGDFARNYDSYVNGQSAYFVWLNRGKESVLFNLKDPADVKLLHSLLASADVFIQNLAQALPTAPASRAPNCGSSIRSSSRWTSPDTVQRASIAP